MIIKIAIADTNTEYVERILNVLEGYKDISLSVYTEKRALEQALASKSFDVFLFDPSIYDGQIEVKDSTLTVMLYDDTVEVSEICRGFQKIHKYQRISRIYQQILELYAEMCGDMGSIVGHSRVTSIAFYSPAGGVGKTTLALAAATRLAVQGYRTFYLNLEDIASEDFYLPQNGERGLSELASCLYENINFTMKIQGLMQNKGERLYYLNHFDSPNDICEMTGEELATLIELIEKTQLFDVVVIDMGIAVDNKVLEVFKTVDKIVLVEKSDATAYKKIDCFLSQSHIINEYGEKMNRVLNFDIGRGSALTTKMPLVGRISAIHNPDAAQFVTMLANSASCSYILKLLG